MQVLKESSVLGRIGREFLIHTTARASGRPPAVGSPRGGMRLAFFVIQAFLLFLTLPTHAHAYDPLEFVPQQVPDARLSGEGTLRRYGEPVYSARLFIDPGTFSPEDLSRESFALDFEYAKSCSGAHIANDVKVGMRDMGIATATQTNRWTTGLAKFLPSLKSDDHLTAVFWPGRGTGFFLNGEPVGEIRGDAFARAYFAIWLDESSTVPGLRHQLLDGSR